MVDAGRTRTRVSSFGRGQMCQPTTLRSVHAVGRMKDLPSSFFFLSYSYVCIHTYIPLHTACTSYYTTKIFNNKTFLEHRIFQNLKLGGFLQYLTIQPHIIPLLITRKNHSSPPLTLHPPPPSFCSFSSPLSHFSREKKSTTLTRRTLSSQECSIRGKRFLTFSLFPSFLTVPRIKRFLVPGRSTKMIFLNLKSEK